MSYDNKIGSGVGSPWITPYAYGPQVPTAAGTPIVPNVMWGPSNGSTYGYADPTATGYAGMADPEFQTQLAAAQQESIAYRNYLQSGGLLAARAMTGQGLGTGLAYGSLAAANPEKSDGWGGVNAHQMALSAVGGQLGIWEGLKGAWQGRSLAAGWTAGKAAFLNTFTVPGMSTGQVLKTALNPTAIRSTIGETFKMGGKAAQTAAEGANLAKTGASFLGRMAPVISWGVAALDVGIAAKTLSDDNASTKKKVLAGVTAGLSTAAAACSHVPVVGTAASAILSVGAAITGWFRDKS